MKRTAPLLIIILLSPLFVFGDINFNRLDNSRGLPQINVLSIYQDETEVMWFGTTTGLCRYNGYSIQVFRPSPKYSGLTHYSIRDITGNGNGSVYIRAEYDVVRYDIAREQFQPIMKNKVATAMFYRNGVLWIGAANGVYTYSEQKDSLSLHADTKHSMGNISTMYVSEQGDVWIGGFGGLIVLKADGTKSEILPAGKRVNAFHVDTDGLVWAGTRDDGVYVFDEGGVLRSHFAHQAGQNSISNNAIRTIVEDEQGAIWIGTFFGLNRFDKNTGLWTNYFHDDTRPHSLSNSSINALYRDVQNTIWVGTQLGGVNYFNSRSNIFQYYNSFSVVKNSLSFPFVGNMAEDGSGNLWICTQGGGLYCLDMSSRKFTRYLYDGFDSSNATWHNLQGICYYPRTDKLYVGVRNAGLYVFDPKTKEHKVVFDPQRSVREIRRHGDEIVLLSWNGLYKFDTDTNRIVPFSDDQELNLFVNRNYINSFLIDSRNRLWLSHTNLTCIDLDTKEIKYYVHDQNDPRSFGRFGATSIIETANGELFFGTLGSGLFRYNPETDDFDNYSEENKRQLSNFSYHISETTGGNIIVLHVNAMTLFDPGKEQTIYRSPPDFPISSFFANNSSYTTREGETFIGGANGMVSFEEACLTDSLPDYSLYFDRMTVNGNYVLPGDSTKILSKALLLTDKVDLKHSQNYFSIEFATSNYLQHGNITGYKYKLEGLDRDWNYASSNRITYASVEPGKYNLILRELRSGEECGDVKTRSVAITVSPPFYKSIFAYILYGLFSAAFIFGIIFLFLWRYRVRTSIEMERKEKENNERVNEMKFRFFIYISHEFRTPLTLIMAQLEHIFSIHSLESVLKQDLSKVYDNATHMRELISELLNFWKAEQGFNSLKIEEVDLIEYIGGIYHSFTEYADKLGMKYVYNFPLDGVVMAHIDKSQLKKAIYSLLSNAFKYTPSGGEITISLCEEEGNIRILVEDDGPGIPPDELSRIFDLFYRAEHHRAEFHIGTGIGLAMAKKIVESHKGEISVSSTLNEGSVFEIKLLKGSLHFDPDEMKLPPPLAMPAELTVPVPAAIPETIHSEAPDGSWSILIVEDNKQQLELLADIFSAEYKVYTAVNGKAGLEMAEEYMPDIILTDVMMPEMSGKEMCHILKNTVSVSHIPVVMLTALDSADQTIEGLIFGADDYVAKPFNVEVLKARCRNLVRNRKLLYRNVIRSKELTGIEVKSEQEAKIIEKAIHIIRMNSDNPDFDMNILASELGVGRNKLYVTMKAITGMTPNEFTLVVKLRDSTDLLKNHLHLNISDIAIKLGFSSAKYFSKCFKTFYGITPAQWRKNNSDAS